MLLQISAGKRGLNLHSPPFLGFSGYWPPFYRRKPRGTASDDPGRIIEDPLRSLSPRCKHMIPKRNVVYVDQLVPFGRIICDKVFCRRILRN